MFKVRRFQPKLYYMQKTTLERKNDPVRFVWTGTIEFTRQ